MRVPGATPGLLVLMLVSTGFLPAVWASGPTVTIDSHSDGEVVDGTVTLAGSVASDTGLRGVRVRVDGGDWNFASTSGSGSQFSWSYALDTTVLTNAAHLVEVEASDAGGIWGSASVQLVVDNPIYHDLAVVAIDAPQGPVGALGVLEGADVTVIIANNGNQPNPAVALNLEYRYFDEWTEVDRVVVESVAEETSADFTLHWDTTLKFGEFDIRVTVDVDGVLAEQDEDNNVGASTVALYSDGGGVLGASDPLYPLDPDPVHRQAKLIQILGSKEDAVYTSPVHLVRVGDHVQWWNGDDTHAIHTATADDGSFDTGWIEALTYTLPVVFTEPGVYTYHCEIHPDMEGRIVAIES